MLMTKNMTRLLTRLLVSKIKPKSRLRFVPISRGNANKLRYCKSFLRLRLITRRARRLLRLWSLQQRRLNALRKQGRWRSLVKKQRRKSLLKQLRWISLIKKGVKKSPTLKQRRLRARLKKARYLSHLRQRLLRWLSFKQRRLIVGLKRVMKKARRLSKVPLRPYLLPEESLKKALKTYGFHQFSALRTSRHLMSEFLKKRRPLLRKHCAIGDRIVSLFGAAIKGRRYDFPGKRERFRWPARILETTVIHPAVLWDLLTLKTWAFGTVFSAAHSPAGLPKDPTAFDLTLLQLIGCIRQSKDFYNQEGAFPLALAPLALFKSSFPFPSQLFAVFWQPPISPIDCNSFLDNFYAHEPTYSIWLGLVQRLVESPGATSHFLLWDFAARELEFWTRFFNGVKREVRLSTANFIRMLTHPVWLYQQLLRIVLAAPFLPPVVRHPLLNNFLRLAKLSKQLSIADKNRLSAEATYGPLNEVRMNSWFKKQGRYLRNQRYALTNLPGYVQTRRLLKLLKIYRRLHRTAPRVTKYALFRLLKLRNFYGSFLSERFQQFYLGRKQSKSRRRRQRFLSLEDKALCRNSYGETRLRRKRKVMTAVRGGGVYVAFNKPFLWHLLLLWLVAYFRRIVIGSRGHYLSRWILMATSDFPLPLGDARPWFLTWTTIGFGRFIFTNSHYRLACLHWIKPAAKTRRRAYFRRWFTGFFYRSRKSAWRFRSRIPRYYRRFKFIRSLPFSSFRIFWPQSANFIRSRFTNRRSYRRSAIAFKRRRPSPTSFKLIQPRSTYLVKRSGAKPLTQLAVSRQFSFF